MRIWLKRLGILLLILMGAVAVAMFVGYRSVSGSLPLLEGELEIAGLSAPVRIERDANGVPTVAGEHRLDVARGLGFLHAQERFFQMDLLRRQAAGELSALIGESALSLDQEHRVHRMRSRAKKVVEQASPDVRAMLAAYCDGIAAGLGALREPPLEYLLLQQTPTPWVPEDSVLVIAAMFFELNDTEGLREAAAGLVHETLPAELARFLTPPGTEWDAPVIGDVLPAPPIPSAAVVDTRAFPARSARKRSAPARPAEIEQATWLGSNNWALAGQRTQSGVAMLANDMHLGHAVPNIWYRAVLEWADRRLVGVTLPGTPSLIAGSNGDIAWGFTNSNGDWTDLIIVETHPEDPTRYRTPDGWRSFDIGLETIEVHDSESVQLEVRETIWGPVIGQDHHGRPRAMSWTAHHPEALNLELGRLETARTLAEALDRAAAAGIPPQNFVCAAADGSIGWTIAGGIPKRVGFDGRVPVSWADGERRWEGWFTPAENPRIVDPDGGAIWTANARVVDGDMLAQIGDGGYAFGARAKQIRDRLETLDGASESDLLEIQLDDRALFLEQWRRLLLGLVRQDEELQELEFWLDGGWTDRASVDSVGYSMVRELHYAIFEDVFNALTESSLELDDRFNVWYLRQWDGPLWRLVSEKPPHLVPPPYNSWNEALSATIKARLAAWREEGPLEERTWGATNTVWVRHPLSRAIPSLSPFIDMPPRQLPGDANLPRVQTKNHGASERLVVSPGREQEGLFHMPGGQSGHPLSPYYGAGQKDWEEGRPSPLLPGKTLYRLTLNPAQ